MRVVCAHTDILVPTGGLPILLDNQQARRGPSDAKPGRLGAADGQGKVGGVEVGPVEVRVRDLGLEEGAPLEILLF